MRCFSLLVAAVLSGSGIAKGQIDLEVTANPDPVRRGEVVEVVLLVSNTSGTSQSNLTVELDMPAATERVPRQL